MSCVASCRQMMAPHMAPSDTGGGTVSRYTRVPDWPSPRRVTVPGCQGLSGAPCRLGAVEDRAGSVRGCARIDLVCAHALACTDGVGGCTELRRFGSWRIGSSWRVWVQVPFLLQVSRNGAL